MQCCFCDKPVASIEEAVDLGWCPDFWNEDLQYQGPVCPECQCEHLETDEDGEFELKTGHSLPPFVVRQCHAPLESSPFDIKCMFCGTKVDNIEPFCPACKQEHFMRNEDGEEVLKPGHEMPPSFPLSILKRSAHTRSVGNPVPAFARSLNWGKSSQRPKPLMPLSTRSKCLIFSWKNTFRGIGERSVLKTSWQMTKPLPAVSGFCRFTGHCSIPASGSSRKQKTMTATGQRRQ